MTQASDHEQPVVAWRMKRCYALGCHDFTDPVVVRTSQFIIGKRETAVVFCRRCGQTISHGWEQ